MNCQHTPLPRSAIYLLCIALVGCKPKLEDTPEYKAACEGPPLNTQQAQNALEEGYEIHRQYKCIDKASYQAVKQSEAQRAAANTPEALAKRQAEFEAQQQRDNEERARKETEQAEADEAERLRDAEPVHLRMVDVNLAQEAELAEVIGIGPKTAAAIVAERQKGRFNGWGDLVARVLPFQAAQYSMSASICGLTVDGNSLPGALPNANMAQVIRNQQRKRHKNKAD